MNELLEQRIKSFAIDTSLATIGVLIALGVSNNNFVMGRILLYLTFVLVYILPVIVTQGQTYGKNNQKIRIVHSSGRNASKLIVILRTLFILILSFSTFTLYLVVVTLIKGKDEQRVFHDYIFNTRVISLKRRGE